MVRQVNSATIEMIKGFESLRLVGYLPTPNDVPTIGYGHTGPDIKVGMICTEEQAIVWLQSDLSWAENAVETHAKGLLTDNEFGALVSITFNIGAGAFDSSTLLKDLNSTEITEAADQFLVWDKQRGTTLPGLEHRREVERTLFLTPDAA